MQSSRMCPTCHHMISTEQQYCPYCHNAVDPALLADLHWMYRTLQDLDKRIEAGQGSRTIQALHDEILADYQARGTDVAAAVESTATATAAGATAVGSMSPPAISGSASLAPVGHPFSWSAFFAEQSIAILAYTGAFLLLVATLSFEVGGWQALNDTAKLVIVLVVYGFFGIAGFVLLSRERLRTISQAYLGIFALMTPLVGLAVYQFALHNTTLSVQGMISVTAWYTTLVYLALALRTHFQQYSYMGWVVGVLAAQSILLWANLSSDWSAFVLAISAMILLIPSALRLPHFFARPALIVDMLASALLVVLVEIKGLSIVSVALTPGAQNSGQYPFTLAAVTMVPLALGWALTARSARIEMPTANRKYAVEWLDRLVIWLSAQAIAAIGGDLHIALVHMSDLLAVEALAAGIVALVYRRQAADRADVRWSAWMLALALPIVGWLINVSLPDPSQPLIVSLSTGALVSFALAASERTEWWVIYSGLALAVVFHSAIIGIIGSAGLKTGSDDFAIALAWSHVGFAVALWALSLALTFPAAQRFSRPAYVLAAANGLYASLLILAMPDFPHHLAYRTVALASFAALALIAGLRERERIASGIAVGAFGTLALMPYLFASGSYWQWFIPPLAAALAALGIRIALGRCNAIPLYVVTLVGLALGQIRLFSDSQASVDGTLGITVAVWFTLIFGAFGIVIAAIEDGSWIIALAAYCGLVAIIGTSNQLAGYALSLVVVLASIALRAWRGRWWNIWLLAAGVLAITIEVGRFGDSDPHIYALKLIFLAVTALLGYASVVLDRGYPETVIAATLLIFLPMFAQSVTSSMPGIFTASLAVEAIVMTMLGVGMRARSQMYVGSGFVGLAALRGAVLAYNSGIPMAVIIAGMAIFLLAVATWLSVQSRALSPNRAAPPVSPAPQVADGARAGEGGMGER
jgi:hypothetical protein